MRRTMRTLSLLLLAAILLGTMTIGVCASEYTDPASAQDFLDNYDSNVASDPNFDENIATALATVREEVSGYATILSLLPPVIAIALALITKEVYVSLFVGILSGALMYSNWNIWGMVTNTTDVMIGKVSDSWNVGILIFLVLLGMMVSLINKAGGSAAYGRWASQHIKTRTGAIISTAFLGMLIFIDDYFNCLTVGSVMKPVTDKHNVSRAKLSYIIDATAAPVCIIAPISSWAAAVSSVAPEGQGLTLFIQSIPYNLYALLTLACVIIMAVMKLDFGPMKLHEENALKGDLFTTAARPYAEAAEEENGRGKVITFKQFTDSFAEGFKAMVPAILILTFAWTLSGVTSQMGATVFVAEFVRTSASHLANLLPAIVFLIAIGLAFATGTSWGTFGVLLPIVCAVFPSGELMIISVAACLAGAVCGDHCSPISDTTIMASTGGQCDHINHVNTQLPYAMMVAGVSFVGYILAGFVQNAWIVLPVSAAILVAVLFLIRATQKKAA